MWKRPDTLDHLQARAELKRRRSRYMLTSAIGTSASAIAAAIARWLGAESPAQTEQWCCWLYRRRIIF
jgi:hypothetical protein